MTSEDNNVKIYTKDKKHTEFPDSEEKWTTPFYFIQGADIQFGLIERYIEKLPNPGWECEKVLAKKCVEKINALRPRPKFFVICGDLCDAMPNERPEERKLQEADFYKIFNEIDPSIPLVCVCGNHDVGDHPTVETVQMYRSSFGDDYFSFWAGGVLFLVINSQYFYDGSGVKDIYDEQNTWLDERLKEGAKSKFGPVIFQHIPWFLEDPNDEKPDYFTIPIEIRKIMLEKLYNAGVRYIFCGHYHRNSGGFYKQMASIVTSAIGGPLGNDKSGFRIVKVLNDKITHEYFALDDVPSEIKIE